MTKIFCKNCRYGTRWSDGYTWFHRCGKQVQRPVYIPATVWAPATTTVLERLNPEEENKNNNCSYYTPTIRMRVKDLWDQLINGLMTYCKGISV